MKNEMIIFETNPEIRYVVIGWLSVAGVSLTSLNIPSLLALNPERSNFDANRYQLPDWPIGE